MDRRNNTCNALSKADRPRTGLDRFTAKILWEIELLAVVLCCPAGYCRYTLTSIPTYLSSFILQAIVKCPNQINKTILKLIPFSLNIFTTFVMSIFVSFHRFKVKRGRRGGKKDSQQNNGSSDKYQAGAETFHCDRSF